MSNDFLSSKEFDKLRKVYQESVEEDNENAEKFWNNLSYEDQCNAFHYVVKKICEGELKDKGSFRHVLYDKFNFGPDMYARAMDCGYMELHNSIVPKE